MRSPRCLSKQNDRETRQRVSRSKVLVHRQGIESRRRLDSFEEPSEKDRLGPRVPGIHAESARRTEQPSSGEPVPADAEPRSRRGYPSGACFRAAELRTVFFRCMFQERRETTDKGRRETRNDLSIVEDSDRRPPSVSQTDRAVATFMTTAKIRSFPLLVNPLPSLFFKPVKSARREEFSKPFHNILGMIISNSLI